MVYSYLYIPFQRTDILRDETTDAWTVSYLAVPRRQLTGATIGTRAIFAGHICSLSYDMYTLLDYKSVSLISIIFFFDADDLIRVV